MFHTNPANGTNHPHGYGRNNSNNIVNGLDSPPSLWNQDHHNVNMNVSMSNGANGMISGTGVADNSAMGRTNTNTRRSGSSSSIHSGSHGQSHNIHASNTPNAPGAPCGVGVGGVNSLDWQAFMTAASAANANANQNGAGDTSVSPDVHGSGNVSPTNYQGQQIDNGQGSGAPGSADPAMLLLNAGGNVNVNPALLHGMASSNPSASSLAQYMNMGGNMGMGNMGLNMAGYMNGLGGPTSATSPSASAAILSSQLHGHPNAAAFLGMGMNNMAGMSAMMGGVGGIASIGRIGVGVGAPGAGAGLGNMGMNMGGMGSMGSLSSHHHHGSHHHHRPHKLVKARRKKPKDHPSRPLSAYNLFFKDERKSILEGSLSPSEGGENEGQKADNSAVASPDKAKGKEKRSEGGKDDEDRPPSGSSPGKKRQPHGKIGFENLAKTIGARWREISPERLAYYQRLAKKDHERYGREMKVYEQKLKNLKAKEEQEKKEQQQKQQEDLQESQEPKCSIQGQADDETGHEYNKNEQHEGEEVPQEEERANKEQAEDLDQHSKEDGLMSKNQMTSTSSFASSSSFSGKRSREASTVSVDEDISSKKFMKTDRDIDSASISTAESVLHNKHVTSEMHTTASASSLSSSAGVNLHPTSNNNDHMTNTVDAMSSLGKDHSFMGSTNNTLSSILMNGGTAADLLMRHSTSNALGNGKQQTSSREKEILHLLQLQQLQQNLLGGAGQFGNAGIGGGMPSISSMLAAQGIPEFAASGGGGNVQMNNMDLLHQIQMANGGIPSAGATTTSSSSSTSSAEWMRNVMLANKKNGSGVVGSHLHPSMSSKNGDNGGD